MTSDRYQLVKAYRTMQAEADKASTASENSHYALEHFDMARKSQRLNVAASLIFAALTEYDNANMTAEQRYFAGKH